MKYECFAAGLLMSAIVSLLGDYLIRQSIIQPLYEAERMPNECIKYRQTLPHMISVAVLGMTVFAGMTLIQQQVPALRHDFKVVGM